MLQRNPYFGKRGKAAWVWCRPRMRLGTRGVQKRMGRPQVPMMAGGTSTLCGSRNTLK